MKTKYILQPFMILLTFWGGRMFAQDGTPCTTCPTPKEPPITIQNGNQAIATNYTATVCGLNYVYGSVKIGKRGAINGVNQPAPITISGLPACCSIQKAYLYGDASGNGIAVTATILNPALVSNNYAMSIIGSAPDKCWGYAGSYSYRADITTAISGNGTYQVSGLPTGNPNDFDGVTILIVYSDPTQLYNGTIIIADGAHEVGPGTISDVTSMPAACANSTYANAFMLIGDLQKVANTTIRMNSAVTNYTELAINDDYWNFITTTVSPVTSGQTTVLWGATNTSDCYNLVAGGLYYRTNCTTCSPPTTMSLTSVTAASCSTGAATVTPVGGTGPYTYSWSPGTSTSSTVSGTPGVYTVTVKDAGCNVSTITVTLTSAPPPSINLTSTQASCANPVSTATAIVSGGATSTSFSVTWSPTPATVSPTSNGSTAAGLPVGGNTVTVTDALGCTASGTLNFVAVPITSFSINVSGGSPLLNCLVNTLTLTAVNTSTLSNVTYTWNPGNFTGNPLLVTTPGTYTVVGTDLTVGACPDVHTITITQNLTAPIVNVNPLSGIVSCNGFPVSFTATCTSPTTNIFGNWYDPSGTPMGSPSGSMIPMTTANCGVYSVTYTFVTSGCTTTKQVTVTCNPSVPTMTVNALDGYVINCLKPCLKFNITASAGPAPKTYSWTNMTTSITTVPATGGYTICTPGNYLAEYEDGNFCRISQQITVSIDTLRPSPTATTNLAGGSFTLSCFQPSLVATAVTSPMLPISNYSWTVPPSNLTISTPTIAVDQTSVTASPTNFTVLATGLNGCVGRAKIQFYKDVFVPPYTAVFTPSAITCSNPSVALSPNSTSSSTIPVTFTFTSPPPTTTASAAGSLFSIPGTYTMTYQSMLNGCTAVTTTVVPLNVVPPATVTVGPMSILCGALTTTINAGTTIQPNYYTYLWTGPTGVGFSCSSCYSTSVNMTGDFNVTITNTINGCTSSNTVSVISTTVLPVSLTADPTQGFAPLPVGFTNNTQLGSTTSGTVTTTWSYGNGSSMTYTNLSAGGSPNGSTTYEAPGTYTVLLIVQQATGIIPGPGLPAQGYCVGTATAVINVDIPSELVIPNVFTPNNDGVNDVFVVQSTAISSISCLIYDRWGVKMYDVTSDKGQIGWDGKNLSGKEVPTGTYFYIIKATGRDGQNYDKKGTVNIYR